MFIKNFYYKFVILTLIIISISVGGFAIYQRETKQLALKNLIEANDKKESEAPRYDEPNSELKDIQSRRVEPIDNIGNYPYKVEVNSLLQNQFDSYIFSKFGILDANNPNIVINSNKEQDLLSRICLDQKFSKQKYEMVQVGQDFFVELDSKKYQIKESRKPQDKLAYQRDFKEQVFLSLMKQHPEANPLQIKDEINKQILEIRGEPKHIMDQSSCFVLEEIK